MCACVCACNHVCLFGCMHACVRGCACMVGTVSISHRAVCLSTCIFLATSSDESRRASGAETGPRVDVVGRSETGSWFGRIGSDCCLTSASTAALTSPPDTQHINRSRHASIMLTRTYRRPLDVPRRRPGRGQAAIRAAGECRRLETVQPLPQALPQAAAAAAAEGPSSR